MRYSSIYGFSYNFRTLRFVLSVLLLACQRTMCADDSCHNASAFTGDAAFFKRVQEPARISATCGLHPGLPTFLTLAKQHSWSAHAAAIDSRQSAVDLWTNDPLDGLSASAWGSASRPSLRALGLAESAFLQWQWGSNQPGYQRASVLPPEARVPRPADVLVPRPGQPGGPAAAPLMLLYRRDWWAALVAGGGGAGGGADVAAALPATWPQLLRLAAALLNRDLDGDGRPDHVLCIDLMPGCKGWAVLSSIYASLSQTHGTAQGLWLCPQDLGVQLDPSALTAALQLYGALAALNPAAFNPPVDSNTTQSDGGAVGSASASSASLSLSTVEVTAAEILAGGGQLADTWAAVTPLCGALNPLFTAGRCLFTVDWATAALRVTGKGAPAVSGRLGAALLPGSTSVVGSLETSEASAGAASPPMDPKQPAPHSAVGRPLVPCTETTCPKGDPLGRDADTGSGPAGAQTSQRLNSAPFVAEATGVWFLTDNVSFINRTRAGEFLRHVGYELDFKYALLMNLTLETCEFGVTFFANVTVPRVGLLGLRSMLGPQLGSGATAAPACDAGMQLFLTALASAVLVGGGGGTSTASDSVTQLLDMDPRDIAAVASAARQAVFHTNAALDITLPYSSDYRRAIDRLAAGVLAAAAAKKATAATDSAAPAADSPRHRRRRRLTADEASQPPTQPLSTSPGPGQAQGWDSDQALPTELQLGIDWQLVGPWAQALGQDFQAAINRSGDIGALKQTYCATINCPDSPPGPTSPALDAPSGSSSSDSHTSLAWRIGLPLGIALGLALLALLAGLILGRRIWGRAAKDAWRLEYSKPPGEGPATTLVMTDVQNSTLLWEVLSADLMDGCLSIHHRIMRESIGRHRGYEAFTEGDAFAVAFHSPEDALGFALDAQVALLEAEWPPELLEQPDGCEVWAVHRHSPRTLAPMPTQSDMTSSRLPLVDNLTALPAEAAATTSAPLVAHWHHPLSVAPAGPLQPGAQSQPLFAFPHQLQTGASAWAERVTAGSSVPSLARPLQAAGARSRMARWKSEPRLRPEPSDAIVEDDQSAMPLAPLPAPHTGTGVTSSQATVAASLTSSRPAGNTQTPGAKPSSSPAKPMDGDAVNGSPGRRRIWQAKLQQLAVGHAPTHGSNGVVAGAGTADGSGETEAGGGEVRVKSRLSFASVVSQLRDRLRSEEAVLTPVDVVSEQGGSKESPASGGARMMPNPVSVHFRSEEPAGNGTGADEPGAETLPSSQEVGQPPPPLQQPRQQEPSVIAVPPRVVPSPRRPDPRRAALLSGGADSSAAAAETPAGGKVGPQPQRQEQEKQAAVSDEERSKAERPMGTSAALGPRDPEVPVPVDSSSLPPEQPPSAVCGTAIAVDADDSPIGPVAGASSPEQDNPDMNTDASARIVACQDADGDRVRPAVRPPTPSSFPDPVPHPQLHPAKHTSPRAPSPAHRRPQGLDLPMNASASLEPVPTAAATADAAEEALDDNRQTEWQSLVNWDAAPAVPTVLIQSPSAPDRVHFDNAGLMLGASGVWFQSMNRSTSTPPAHRHWSGRMLGTTVEGGSGRMSGRPVEGGSGRMSGRPVDAGAGSGEGEGSRGHAVDMAGQLHRLVGRLWLRGPEGLPSAHPAAEAYHQRLPAAGQSGAFSRASAGAILSSPRQQQQQPPPTIGWSPLPLPAGVQAPGSPAPGSSGLRPGRHCINPMDPCIVPLSPREPEAQPLVPVAASAAVGATTPAAGGAGLPKGHRAGAISGSGLATAATAVAGMSASLVQPFDSLWIDLNLIAESSAAASGPAASATAAAAAMGPAAAATGDVTARTTDLTVPANGTVGSAAGAVTSPPQGLNRGFAHGGASVLSVLRQLFMPYEQQEAALTTLGSEAINAMPTAPAPVTERVSPLSRDLFTIYSGSNTGRMISVNGHKTTTITAAAVAAAADGGGSTGTATGRLTDSSLVLVFRGLRVRMGLHSGALASEVLALNKEGVPLVGYTGDFLSTAKEVGDAAMGGMIVLSDSAFHVYQQLQHRQKAARDLAQAAPVPPVTAVTSITATAGWASVSLPAVIGGPAGTSSGGLTSSPAMVMLGGASQDVMLLHLGQHLLKEPTAGSPGALVGSPQGRDLYTAVRPCLAPRLALLPCPVRTACEVVPGCLSAPAGVVAPVFCNVVGVEALMAWEALVCKRLLRAAALAASANLNPCRQFQLAPAAGGDVSTSGGAIGPGTQAPGGGNGQGGLANEMRIVSAALGMFRDLARSTAAAHGGYVVASSSDGGNWVLVFGSPERAVRWGLDMLGAMLRAAWPEGFLEHELTEEVWEDGVLRERGLRLRMGIDVGQAMIRLVPRTGRLDYVGRPMNRAARIVGKAKSSSLLVSGAAWEAVQLSLEPLVVATSLGSMQLKGVQEQLELWALKPRLGAAASGKDGQNPEGGEGRTG